MPEDFWDAQAKTVKGKEFREQWDQLNVWKAAETAKAAQRPQEANAYKIDLPADWKPPEGVEFQFKQDDPLMVHARAWAHTAGLTQEQFSQALGLYASAQVGMNQQIQQAREAEIQKLGSNAQARVDSLIAGLKGLVGEEATKSLTQMMVTANIVGALEKMISRFASQGAMPSNALGRDMASRSISDDEWNRMSYHEKATYQREFASRNGR